MAVIVLDEIVEERILLVRGQKVMLDRDLAELYGVETRVLNQAVKRNKDSLQEFEAVISVLKGEDKGEVAG